MNKIRLIVNNEVQKKNKEKFFIKKELQSILNLYAKMVSNGSWKDYSFTSGVREVSFNVYQRASDKPVLRILKNLKPQYFNERYLIKDKNGIVLKKSEDLNQLIKLLEIDDNNLYNFYNGLNTEVQFEDNKINNLFKNFKY